MSFISYAQNYEDVMLWRALGHIESGFYIDVGANDPSVDSVTRAFYDRGWHGINIEPLKQHYEDLTSERERDINLLAAAGSHHGEIEIWECDIRGWATASPEVISMHEADGHVGSLRNVPVLPLSDICAQYAESEIHFLKIDVEGFEKEVIDGMDFTNYRPWIVVVEATKPNSTEHTHHQWEGHLMNNNYLLAYTDGLNRFYLASERQELLPKLRYPPNVFDAFIRFQQFNSEERARQAEVKAQQAEIVAAQHINQLRGVYASKSWRVTEPLRWIAHLWRSYPSKWLETRPKISIKAAIKNLMAKLVSFLLARPKLKARLMNLARRIGILQQLKLFALDIKTKALHPANEFEKLDCTTALKQIEQRKHKDGVNSIQKTPLESHFRDYEVGS